MVRVRVYGLGLGVKFRVRIYNLGLGVRIRIKFIVYS